MDSTSATLSAPTSSPVSAAPATSAPAPTPTPAERPQTMAEAFARDAASSTPDVSETAPAATVQADATTEIGDSTTAPGPIPFTAHKTALENARTKAKDAALAEFQQQYGWAMQADRSIVETGMQIGQLYQADRPGFIRQVLAEAITDPTLAPLVRSEAARVLGSRQQPQAPQAPDLSPDIPVLDAHGQVVTQTYSADRVQQIVQQAIQDALGKELTPIKQDFESRQQQEQARQQQQALQSEVNEIYREATDVLPGFEDHKDEIAKVFATIPGDPAKALRAAWKQVVGGKLAVADQVKADTLKTLQTQAAASTVNPAAANVSPTKRPSSFLDPSLRWA